MEGIAYLGIAAVVILGAVSLLTSAFSSAEVNRAAEEVMALRTAIKRLYSGQQYPVDMGPDLIAAKLVPSTLSIDAANSRIRNAWGGDVEIYGWIMGSPGGISNNFWIIYRDIPRDACIALLSGTSGWLAVGTTSSGNITSFPITMERAASACTDPLNVLTFAGT